MYIDDEINIGPERIEEAEIIESAGIKFRINFTFALDLKFWAIIPNININFHSKELEFEFLCFEIYIGGEK